MNFTKKDIVDIIFVAVLLICMVVTIFRYTTAKAEMPEYAAQEPTTAATTDEKTKPTQDPTETKPQATAPPVTLYDVPLDEELQLHIIAEAEAHGIDPAIIFAMAFKESTYRTDAVGDGGNSYGLLQVQPRWHYERMQKLGCTDLLDPYQNVTVAIDYLCELLNKYGDMDKALTAYNRGHYAGTVTQYAKTILVNAEELGVIK